jgi:hypothetical protein
MRNGNEFEVEIAALRPIGVVALLAIGAIHFLQIVETFQSTPWLGVAYGGLIAAWLLTTGVVAAWGAAGLIGASVILGYAFTRFVGTTFDNQDVGNWSCMLGLASLFVEAALLAVSGYATALVRANVKASQTALELEHELVLEGTSSVR